MMLIFLMITDQVYSAYCAFEHWFIINILMDMKICVLQLSYLKIPYWMCSWEWLYDLYCDWVDMNLLMVSSLYAQMIAATQFRTASLSNPILLSAKLCVGTMMKNIKLCYLGALWNYLEKAFFHNRIVCVENYFNARSISYCLCCH